MKEKDKNVLNELEELAPFLAKQAKKERKMPPIPQNYFEELQNKVIAKTINAEAENKNIHPLKPKVNYWKGIGAAASISLLFLASFLLWNTKQTKEISFAKLASEQAENYLQQNIEEFEAEEFVASLSDEEFERVELAFLSEQIDWYVDEEYDDFFDDFDEDDIFLID